MLTPADISAIADAVATRLSGQPDSDGLLDSHGAARLLGCSVPTVERWTRAGLIPSRKFGRLRRYRRSDLLANKNGGHDA
ncbi:MAG: helix-turn-helix domain-containing protein [Pirellulaceae bacterium]|nr:helix-turn-helix domain-containing protein [Pirellulaceae bacterium]